MKIKQIYIGLGFRGQGKPIRNQYENSASYMSLAISDWIKSLNLDLGEFNRISFHEEINHLDFELIDISRTLIICLSEEFQAFEQFSSAQVVHDYFKRKYIEGFKRFDAHFKQNLTPDLILFLGSYFKNGYLYEKEIKSRLINKRKHIIIKQYKYDVFNLLLRITDRAGKLISETVLETAEPDLYIVYWNFKKVEIIDNKILVMTSTNTIHSEHIIPLIH